MLHNRNISGGSDSLQRCGDRYAGVIKVDMRSNTNI